MAVKFGTFTIPSPTEFSITGLGFKPRWGIFLYSKMSTEDTWISGPSAGIGMSAFVNGAVNQTNIRTMGIGEVWQGGAAAGSFLGDVTMWTRATRGSDGWALYVKSHDADGFTFRYANDDTFSSGAGGQRIYYIAGDELYDEVSLVNAFVPGSGASSLGWQPEAFFGIGAGGGVGSPGSVQSQSFADISIPSVCAGYFDDDGSRESIYQMRGLLDPNVDVQEWWGNEDGAFAINIPTLEETQSVGTWFGTFYDPGRTATSFVPSFPGAGSGFSLGHVRMGTMVFGSVSSIVGTFAPLGTVGVETEVVLPFDPEVVVFFSPESNDASPFDTRVYGVTGWGFVTPDDDQALLVYGGYWNPPNAFQSNGMISRSRCWVANASEGSTISFGNVGNIVTAGSARIIPGGFAYTTEESAASVRHPVHYWAIGPKEEAPGFFRRY